ncbi:MAG TPA: (Fe-S)-binding protein [Gaiella sp.]|nr:(Fe-S)-binding protein [Gaiella sp.]
MRVALLVTCLADTLQPSVGRATVALLERLGIEVVFPREQTCCGQLHLNAGHAEVAAGLAHRFVDVFSGFDAVVAPSASCAAHVRAHVPEHAADPEGVASRTWELSEFLVERLGVVDVGSGFAGSVTYHPTCHSLRALRVGDGPELLLRAVRGLDLRPLGEASECCGFGGLFAVRNAGVSTAMLADKLRRIEESGAGVVCACDASCLLHIGGGLERRGAAVRAVHLAEILAA